jgi:hypothetical protein
MPIAQNLFSESGRAGRFRHTIFAIAQIARLAPAPPDMLAQGIKQVRGGTSERLCAETGDAGCIRATRTRHVSFCHMADALRRCNDTVSYLGVTRRARGVPRNHRRRPSLTPSRHVAQLLRHM